MALSEGAGRASRVDGEPSSEAWKLIEGCHISSEAWKLIEGCQTLERGESLSTCRPNIERSGSLLEGG
jgi:hypothetical protein